MARASRAPATPLVQTPWGTFHSGGLAPAKPVFRNAQGLGVAPPRPGTPIAGGVVPYNDPHGARVGQGTAGWTPPPIPGGFYNPIRDLELAEGKRGSQQTITGLQRQRTNVEQDYGINKSLIERNAQQALGRIADSSARLGARQGEGANTTGTLYGGALLTAAARRASNQGAANHPVEQGRADSLGRLSQNEERMIGVGGQITEALTNANQNEQGFEEGVGTLKGNEAAGRGYEPPEPPRLAPPVGYGYGY